jgi:hypothetical protein
MKVDRFICSCCTAYYIFIGSFFTTSSG